MSESTPDSPQQHVISRGRWSEGELLGSLHGEGVASVMSTTSTATVLVSPVISYPSEVPNFSSESDILSIAFLDFSSSFLNSFFSAFLMSLSSRRAPL